MTAYSKEIGLAPIRIRPLEKAKHIFSHIEWHMTGYEVIVDELEKTNEKGFLFALPEEIGKNIRFRPRLRSMSNMQGSKAGDGILTKA